LWLPSGKSGVKELERVINDRTLAGHQPEIIIVDGLSGIVERWMNREGVAPSWIWRYMEGFSWRFRDLCCRRGTRGIVTHHLAPGSRSRLKPDHTMAAGCRSLGDRFDHVLILGHLTPDGYGTIIRTKGKSVSDMDAEVIVHLNDDLSRFETSEDYYYFDRLSGE